MPAPAGITAWVGQTEASMSDKSTNGEESPAERANRELIELLNELRVALPGVQVLFAFLLTVPFSQRFERLEAWDRRVYFTAVVATAVATLLLIAPSAHHRIRFRSRVKEHLLRVANVCTVLGLLLLAFAMTAVTYVITGLVYRGSVPAVVAGCLAGGFVVVWFLLPLLYRPEATPPPSSPGE
jgi:hypothetical protein